MLRGLVITGTSGSGKSTLADWLVSEEPSFELVQAVTTRPRRASDREGLYRFCSEKEFHSFESDLFVETRYRGRRYGILSTEISRVEKREKVPILTLAPDCLESQELAVPRDVDGMPPGFMTIFLDAADSTLLQRLQQRDGDVDALEVRRRAEEDRKFSSLALYRLAGGTMGEIGELALALWRSRGSSGIVGGYLIKRFIKVGALLEEGDERRVSGASYDLSLGDEYFYGGRIHRLSKTSPFLLIEPYDYAIVTSNEVPRLPPDIAARFDLSVSLFCQGLILSNGPQVDPGFHGPLFCLLFNTSSSPVLLKRRQHYATLEFHKLAQATFPYKGSYQGKELLHYLPTSASRGAIGELKKELEEVRRESRQLQHNTWAILSLIIALLALFLALN